MKPEQSVLNKLAKFSTKEVELSAQEPIEVELSLASDLNSYVSRLEGVGKYAEALSKAANQEIKKYNDSADELSRLASAADSSLKELNKIGNEAFRMKNDTEKKLAELGLGVNDFPEIAKLEQAIKVADKVSDMLRSASSMNPAKIGYKI